MKYVLPDAVVYRLRKCIGTKTVRKFEIMFFDLSNYSKSRFIIKDGLPLSLIFNIY